MDGLQLREPYTFIMDDIAPSFEAMLGIAYKRLQRLEDKPNNGVNVDGLRDVQIFIACVVRNATTLNPDDPFDSKTFKQQIELTIQDAIRFYERERYTIRTCDKWIVKSQREVW